MENKKWCLHSSCGGYKVHPFSDEFGEIIIADIDPENYFDNKTKEKFGNILASAPELLVALQDLVNVTRSEIMSKGIKKGFSQINALAQAEKILYKVKGGNP